MTLPRRRDLLASVGAAVGALSGCLDVDLGLGDGGDGTAAATVALEPVASGFGGPTEVAFRPGDDRPYVVDQPGSIYRVDDGDPVVVADLADRIVDLGAEYSERGALGLAFHPDGDRAYVRYSAPSRDGTPSDYSHTFVLAEFPIADDGSLDVDGERTVLEIPEPQANHNAGDVAFGPDGYLYVAVGDGGGAGDQGKGHVEDWYDDVPGGNGQDVTENLLGGILRIDVDAETDDRAYAIPEDNPLVDDEGLDEYYAWGLRNPWGMAFDDDRFLVADVGQEMYEEVNVVEAGGNYGWNVREGRHCYEAEDCPTETPEGDPLIDPVLEYTHDHGVAIVGGAVYRGSDVPALDGLYVFGDWQQRLFVADPAGDDWSREDLDVAGGFDRFVLAFGVDHDGELYVATDGDSGPTGDSGRLSRFVPAGENGDSEAGNDGGDGDGDGDVDSDDGSGDGTTATTAGDGTNDSAGGSPGDSTPGFGVVAAILGLGSALLRRLRRRR